MNETIELFLLIALFLLHSCLAMLRDAIRFASFGYLKSRILKRMDEKKRENLTRRMESFFEDEGGRQREIEWTSSICYVLFLLFYVHHFAPESAKFHDLAMTALEGVLAAFFFNLFFLRAFSEPFAEQILIHLFPIWRIIAFLSFPLTKILRVLQIINLRMAGSKETEEDEHEQRILDTMENSERSGVLENPEREMIENIIDSKDLSAGEIMTPRTEMAAVRVDSPLNDVVEMMRSQNFSRILVFEENRDNIVGFVHTRDLLPYWNNGNDAPPLKELIHDPLFAPSSKKIGDLLQEFRKHHQHIAVVLDEYGGTEGVVTMEDILEEIVGEIVDEHQMEEDALFVPVGENAARVSARLRVSELIHLFNMDIDEEEHDDYDSVGGMIIAMLGRIPVQGEQGELEKVNLRFKVLEASQRKIETLLLIKNEEQQTD